jgi:signal peptidase I
MEKVLKFLLWTVAIFAVICGIGRAFFFETWTVPNDPVLASSLAPSLYEGDFVLVLTAGEVEWGDLVRCVDPEDSTRYAVGRVMGMPGDEVELKAGRLTVNGMRYESTEACEEERIEIVDPESDTPMEIMCSRVELGNNWHFKGSSATFVAGNDVRNSTSTNHYFLLSDNRDYHDDSRDFGDIPVDNCKERIFFRLWGKDGWLGSKDRLTFIR